MKYINIFFLLLIFSLTACDTFNGGNDEDPLAIPSNSLPVGATANELLAADQFDKLVVEIQYPQGYAPPAGSIDDMKNFLNKFLNKPGGIEVIANEITVPANNVYSLSEVMSVEANNRTQFNEESTMAIYLFLADGDYDQNEGNARVLGIAYQNTSMALFQKSIQDLSGGVTQPSERLLTSTVLQHEIGHLLGLVNVGTPMVTEHQDESHGKHCDDSNCLMYWSVSTGNVVDNIVGFSSPPDLDSQCKADLKANGGK
ncbi:MAG: peptidase [Candidatus Cyclobacteriaceae bacterium M2_1C_046]